MVTADRLLYQGVGRQSDGGRDRKTNINIPAARVQIGAVARSKGETKDDERTAE
jgi:hypothetical protein